MSEIARPAKVDALPRRDGFSLAALVETLLHDPVRLLLGLALYMAAIALVRTLLFAAAPGDDAEQLFYSQAWRLGYGTRNPPLYTWLVLLSQLPFGPSLVALSLLKATVLWSSFALILRTGQAIGLDRLHAALAALSPLAIGTIAWEGTVSLSHSLLVLPLVLGTWLALIRLDRRGDTGSYLILGGLVGLGLLAKYNYGVFLVAVLATALTDQGLRHRLLDPRALLIVAVAGLLFGPHALWLIEHRSALEATVADHFYDRTTLGTLATLAAGAWTVLINVLGAIVPLALVFPLFFPQAFARLPVTSELGRWRRLIGRGLVATILVFLALTLMSGATELATRYFLALIPLPLYLCARLQESTAPPARRKLYATVMVALGAAVLPAIAIKHATDPWGAREPKMSLPARQLAQDLRRAGFTDGTVFADRQSFDLAGNLRVYFPAARMVGAADQSFVSAPAVAAGQCLVLWNVVKKRDRRAQMLERLAAFAGTAVDPALPTTTLRLPLDWAPSHIVEVAYALFPDGLGNCR